MASRRQAEAPHRRIERREEHVPGSDQRAGQPVEQRRFPGIGIPDQRDHGIRYAAASLAMQIPRPSGRVEFALQPGNAFADQPPVDFELAFAWAAEEAKPAALALEMCPGAHQAGPLIGQRRQLDLQPALMGAGPLAENLQDQARPVDDLGLPAPLEVALLHRAQRSVDDDEPDVVVPDQFTEVFDCAAA